jgi:hypothetical protein
MGDYPLGQHLKIVKFGRIQGASDRTVSRMNTLRKRICAALATTTCVVALAACGSSHLAKIRTPHIATAIAASVLAERHEHATVTCPTTVPLVVHSTFWCLAQVGKRMTPFQVTEASSAGNVTYVGVSAAEAPLIDATKVEAAIRHSILSERHLNDRVSCPVDVPRQAGLVFDCVAGPKHGHATVFAVTQVNSLGSVTYRGL